MKRVKLSKQTARRIILEAQLLDGHQGLKPGKKGLRQIFDRLGYVQIDTIHVIERAHHHVLWTRLPCYRSGMLHDLQSVDRAVFEYWTHAMSYLPMSDYRYCLQRMDNFKNPSYPRVPELYRRGKLPLEPVLKRIRGEGPLSAKDFMSEKDRKGGSWWDWKPAKLALELLFWRGELMITERRNFQKVYDLTERVLPADVDTSVPSEKETARYLVGRALKSMGIAGLNEIQKYMQPAAARDSAFRTVKWDVLVRTIEELREEKKIVTVPIEGEEDERYYAPREAVRNAADIEKTEEFVHLLSPFDNLIIQRDRARRFFDFEYSLECYVPAKKRAGGYFVLPILFGDRIVGRMDPKADRQTKTMIVHSVSLNDDFRPTDGFIKKVAKKTAEFARFNRCDRVLIERTGPAKLKRVLKKAMETELIEGIP